MAENSKISWCDATWNPIAGCLPVSPGCANCYAATMARRLEAMGQAKYFGTAERRGSVDVFTGKINFDEAALSIPLKRKKPTKYFVNSMSDLFHEAVPFEFIDKCFAVMALCPQHVFQVLTKRPERMVRYFLHHSWGDVIVEIRNAQGALSVNASDVLLDRFVAAYNLDDFHHGTRAGNTGHYWGDDEREPIGEPRMPQAWPLPNAWLGVSCEDKARLSRLDILRTIPAAVRFVSLEPLLEDLGEINLSGIHWAITGGESGPKARPHKIEWSRSIGQQCQAAGVAWFHKQHGSNAIQTADYGDGGTRGLSGYAVEERLNLNDRAGSDPSEWGEGWLQQMPAV